MYTGNERALRLFKTKKNKRNKVSRVELFPFGQTGQKDVFSKKREIDFAQKGAPKKKKNQKTKSQTA